MLREVFGDLEPEALATASVLVLERAAGGTRVRWASAGHLPPLLVPPAGPARFLEREPGVPAHRERPRKDRRLPWQACGQDPQRDAPNR